MKRKFLAAIAIFILLSNLFTPYTARAAPNAEDSKWVTVSKINGFDSSLENRYGAQYGLYYNLYYLTLSTRWTTFLYDFGGKHGLGFSEYEKEEYRKKLIEQYKAFNNRFAEKPTAESGTSFYYEPLKLKINEDKKHFLNMTREFLNKTAPSYLEARLADIQKSLDDAGSDVQAKEKVYQENKDHLRYIWKILDVMLNEEDDMKNLLPENATLYLPGTGDAKNIRDTYSELIEKGRELEQAETKGVDNVDIGDSGPYVERVAYATRKTEGEGHSSDLGASNWKPDPEHSGPTGQEFQLRDAYIRMFSASAVYRPLVSHAGDEDFNQALASLFPEENRAEALQLYDEMKDYRKPVYAIYDASKWYEAYTGAGDNQGDVESTFRSYSGEARPIKLKDFVEAVKEEQLMGLVVMKGKLQTSFEDTNTYFYYSDNPRFDGQTPTAETTTPTTPVTEDTPDQDGDEGSEEATTEVAGTEEKKTEKVNNILAAAGDKITSKNWTSTILEVGGPSNDFQIYHTATMTLALLNNIFKNHDFLKGIQEKDNSYLFMNAFGDIVTQDNLIVVPGASNPLFYDFSKGYTPYTVAFMTGYPSLNPRGGKLALGNADDKGKYALVSGGDEFGKTSTFVKVKDHNNLNSTDPRPTGWVQLALAEPILNMGTPLERSQISASLTSAWDSIKASYGSLNVSGKVYKDGLIVVKQDAVMFGTNIANYDPSSDEDYGMAKYIARNMYYSFRLTNGQVGESFNGKLREDFIFRNVLVEALNGTVYAQGYTKTLTETVTNMQGETYGWFKEAIKSWLDEALRFVGDVDGILGVKEAKEDSMFGFIIVFIDKYFWFIIAAVLILFIIKFMRNRASLTHTISLCLLAIVVGFAILKVVPHYLPKAYNFVLDGVNERLSYDILLAKSEKYSQTYKNSGTTDDKGNFVLNTASLTLYNLTNDQLKEVMGRYNIEPSKISRGSTYVLDSNSGLYLEGNSLKLNTDALLYTNPITGNYEDTEYGTIYQMKSEKIHSSVLDYYSPYYQIQDGFLTSLNDLLKVYRIPKHSAQYAGGLTKDSFLLYNYVDSMPFLTPGQYEQQADSLMSAEEIEKLRTVFDNPDTLANSHDFLNLNRFLSNPTLEMQQTLWWRTMIQNGINPLSDVEEDVMRYNKFLEAVNFNVRKFILDFQDQMPLSSDENMIKMVALYATTVFNSKISDAWNQVYPKNVNYQDYVLSDVYLAAFTDDSSRFAAANRDISTFVAENADALTLFAMILNVVLGFLINFSVKFLLPVLYVSVTALIIAKYFLGISLKSVIAGYTKVSVILFICMTVFVSMLSLISGWNLIAAIWVTLMIYIVICYVLFMVFSSLIMNFTELGNSALGENLSKFPGFNKLKDLAVNTLNVGKRRSSRETLPAEKENRYDNTMNMDDYISADVVDINYVQKARSIGTSRRRRRYVYREEIEVNDSNEQETIENGKFKGLD